MVKDIMKKLLYLLVLSCTAFCNAALITLPARDVLIKRLNKLGLAHFVERTNILDQLADKEKEPFGVWYAVKLALSDYTQLVKGNPVVGLVACAKREDMIKAILKDSPQAIDELKRDGLI